jgi:hypothetical protein
MSPGKITAVLFVMIPDSFLEGIYLHARIISSKIGIVDLHSSILQIASFHARMGSTGTVVEWLNIPLC